MSIPQQVKYQTPTRRRRGKRLGAGTPTKKEVISSEVESGTEGWVDEGPSDGLPSPPQSPMRRDRKADKVRFVAREVEKVKPNGKEMEKRADAWVVQDKDKQWNDALDASKELFDWVGGLFLDVVRTLAGLIRKPLSFIIVIYILSLLLSHFLSKLLVPLQPLCSVPILSSYLPFCADSARLPVLPDYPSLLTLQTHLEPILESSSTGTSLALDVKNSELAIRDLKTLVKLSELVSKDELESKLSDFVEEAKEAGRSLQRLGSRVGGAVDNILAFDEYILHTLSSLPTTAERPSLPSTFLSYIVPFYSATPVSARKTLIQTFTAVSQDMQSQIHTLILESEATMVLLDRLENGLNTIHEMVQREDLNVRTKVDDVLAELWTVLGGNRRALQNFSSHRTLLANIGHYRSQALIRVTATAVQLRQLSADLEDLRDRVATPGLVGVEEGGIPVEVHIESIKKGIERLSEFRRRSVEKENELLRKTLANQGQAQPISIQALPPS